MTKKIIFVIFLFLFSSCTEDIKNNNLKNDEIKLVNDFFESIEDHEYKIPNFFLNDILPISNVSIKVNKTTISKGSVLKKGKSYYYKPIKGFVGKDSFTYKICNQQNKCYTATITINVIDQGTPIAKNDNYIIYKNKPLIIDDFLKNDSLIDDSQLESINKNNNTLGKIDFTKDGKILYTPKINFVGFDSFTYTICDDDKTKSCSTATITINIKDSDTTNTTKFNIPYELISYYSNINFSLTGIALKDELATKIINTHTTSLSYDDIWSVLQKSDLDPSNNSKVILIYGYNDNDSDKITDRTRDKNKNGGISGEDWNREHIYAKSLGKPKLGKNGAGSDAHNLRACDVTFNSQRGNRKFITGKGNAKSNYNGWYPGDEWKGDVARIIMYMYLRYANQCLPINVGIGSKNRNDNNMIEIFLEWNADDPVSEIEIQRNKVIYKSQGNRNPFIDNPYLATMIWSGKKAENKWEK